METLHRLARRCSLACPHSKTNRDIERCAECDIILYDRYTSNVQDAPLEDILVSSPRYKKLPDSEIGDLIERFRNENKLIASDLKAGKLRTQKEYIDAQLAATTGTARQLNDNVSMVCVQFQENVGQNLEELFPKVEFQRVASPVLDVHKSVSPTSQEEGPSGLNLASSSSLKEAHIQVYFEPYGPSDFVGVYLDESVRVKDVLRALGQHNSDLRDCVLRWVEDEDDDDDNAICPDFELPPIDPNQVVLTLGVNTVCVCHSSTMCDLDL